MAKNFSTAPMTAGEIAGYLDDKSDFGFEIGVLKALTDRHLLCEHSGSYDDPVTSKKRQFDIRARFHRSKQMAVYFAIECKNLGANYPLVIQRMPRRKEESFHELIYSKSAERRVDGQPNVEVKRLSMSQTTYRHSQHVGKSCQQVGKSGQDIRGDNSEIYDKWTQAINSAYSFLNMAENEGLNSQNGTWIAILPVLVVPEGTLWVADYDELGNRLQDPTQTDRAPFYLDATLSSKNAQLSVTLSHLEICTLSGLFDLVSGFITGSPDETLFDIRQ